MDSETTERCRCGHSIGDHDLFSNVCRSRSDCGCPFYLPRPAAPHAAPREGEPTERPITAADLYWFEQQIDVRRPRRTTDIAKRLLAAHHALIAKSASQQAALDAAGETTRLLNEMAPPGFRVEITADGGVFTVLWIVTGDPGDAYLAEQEAPTLAEAVARAWAQGNEPPDPLAARASHPEARDGE